MGKLAPSKKHKTKLRTKIDKIKHIKTTMVLTEEQRERIRINKERALNIQKERKQKQKEKEQKEINYKINNKRRSQTDGNNNNIQQQEISFTKKQKASNNPHADEDDNVPLEDFEEGASQYVTKKEAKNMYCLPEGSLAVCTYEEKINPHNSKFTPMKLYNRKEIRFYAHKRYKGVHGLINERNKRSQRKLEKDMNNAKDIFK